MTVSKLPPAPAAAEPEPFAGPDHPMRKVTRSVAFEGAWNAERAAKVASLFDGMAAEWAQRVDPTKLAPVADALERGSVPVDGRWLELGSGTGAATTVLADLVRELVALDISGEMLARAAAEPSTSRPTTLSRLFPVPGSPPRRGPAPVSGRSSPGTGEIQASSSSSDRAAV